MFFVLSMAGFTLMSKEIYFKWSADLIIFNWESETMNVDRLNFPAISIIGKYRMDTNFYDAFNEKYFGWSRKYENLTADEFLRKFVTLE